MGGKWEAKLWRYFVVLHYFMVRFQNLITKSYWERCSDVFVLYLDIHQLCTMIHVHWFEEEAAVSRRMWNIFFTVSNITLCNLGAGIFSVVLGVHVTFVIFLVSTKWIITWEAESTAFAVSNNVLLLFLGCL